MANKLTKKCKTGYTVIQNTVFNRKDLKMQEMGLLCKMLSVSDNWEFSVEGFAACFENGIDAVRTTVRGLETKGFLRRVQCFNEKGKFNGYDWEVSDEPIFLDTSADFPRTENHPTENHPTDYHPTENQRQTIPNSTIPNETTVSLNNQSNLNSTLKGRDEMRRELREKTEIDYLLGQAGNKAARDIQSEIYSIYEDIMLSAKPYHVIGGERVPTYDLQQRLSKIHAEHIESISEAILSRTEPIVNIKAYITKCLFDVVVTSETAIWNEIKRDGII